MILLSVIPNTVEYGFVRSLDTGRLKDSAPSAFLSNATGKEISQISSAKSQPLNIHFHPLQGGQSVYSIP
jgi:hypothetical protein